MEGAVFNDTIEGANATGNGTDDDCSNRLRLFTDSERRFILVTDVGLSSTICLLGLLLNALSIVVLKRDVRRSSMSVLLLALAIFDLTFILLSAPYFVVYMGLGSIIRDSQGLTLQTLLHASPGIQLLLPVVWYLGNVARTGRNWIVLLVALDRYMVVQNPFLSTQRSNPQRSRLYCLCVTVVAMLYNLPLFLEYRTDKMSCLNISFMLARPKSLGSAYMLVYKKLLYILLLTVGPMLCLTALNILLIRSLLVASRIRAAITRETTRRTEETKMLVVIIAVFVLTEIPGTVWHILLGTRFDRSAWFNSYLYSVGSLLTLFNSAINFFIYCVWSRNFRRNMLYAMRRRKKPPARVIRFDSDSDRTRQLMLQQQQQLLRLRQQPETRQQQQYPVDLQHQPQQQQQPEFLPMQVLRASSSNSDSGRTSGSGGVGVIAGGNCGSRSGSSDRGHNFQQQLAQRHLRFE